MALQRQLNPTQTVVAIVLVLVVIGGIWWFVRGRGPAPADPQEVDRMMQRQFQSPVPGGVPGR